MQEHEQAVHLMENSCNAISFIENVINIKLMNVMPLCSLTKEERTSTLKGFERCEKYPCNKVDL